MKFLLFSGSLRQASLNKKLLDVAEKILTENTANKVVVADLKSLSIPVYDGDIEAEKMPDGVVKLGKMVQEAQAIVICSPEYNGSIAGSLKNTIDWLSRLKPIPLENKPLLLNGASPGEFGAIRGLNASRAPLERLSVYLYPHSFALPRADKAFTENNDLKDAETKKKFSKILHKFQDFAQKFT